MARQRRNSEARARSPRDRVAGPRPDGGRSVPPDGPAPDRSTRRVGAAELGVRRLERQALAALDASRRADDTVTSLRTGSGHSAVDLERAIAQAQRLEEEAGRRLDQAVRARLDLDVPVATSEGGLRTASTPPSTPTPTPTSITASDHPATAVPELDVVSWNRPDWSWDRLVAAALDEPPEGPCDDDAIGSTAVTDPDPATGAEGATSTGGAGQDPARGKRA